MTLPLLRAAPLAGLIAALLASCASHPVVPPSVLPLAPPGLSGSSAKATAPALAARGTPLTAQTGFPAADLAPALAAFRAACPALVKRADPSGLTQPGDWGAACGAAAKATDGRAFFQQRLVAVQIGDGRGLDTGYYEPDLAAALVHGPGFGVPIYRRPPDLVDLDLGAFDAGLSGKHVRGRIVGSGAGNGAASRFVPYYDRAEIDDGALAGRGLELAWAADPYAAFFLEIQGSGRLKLPDGTVRRIGYDGQNGHAYTGIGKLLRDRGALAPGQATMAGIIGWMRAHPEQGRDLMRQNRSKVFFKLLDLPPGAGPVGALGLPLTARTSVAADPAFVPPGSPLWLDTTVAGAPFRTVVVAQDTGGAIKGANRLDIFWGSGDAAGAVAGGISASGAVTLLLPPAAATRLTDNAAVTRLTDPAAARSTALPAPDAAPPRP